MKPNREKFFFSATCVQTEQLALTLVIESILKGANVPVAQYVSAP